MRFNEPYGASRCPRLTVMSGPELFSRPRRFGRGAALTLVFASVLATGVATGSWSAEGSKSGERPAGSATGGGHEDVRDAAAEAMADGKSPTQAAEEAVSRSGDRWGAVYSQGEYKEFEQELDGQYTGVGLWARRTADGRIEVAKVGSGSPAAHAGVRPGDRLRTVDEQARHRPPRHRGRLPAARRARGDGGPARPGARHARVDRDPAPGEPRHRARHRLPPPRGHRPDQGRRLHQGLG